MIVYDPVESDKWPHHAIKYCDAEQFIEDSRNFREAHVFIDECATLWDHDEVRANELIYRGRHRGLLFILMAQRTRMIRPNARNQCSRIYAFRQQYDDARVLSQEYSDEFLKCVNLPDGECIAAQGLDVSRMTLDYATYPPSIRHSDSTETIEQTEVIEEDHGDEIALDNSETTIDESIE